MGLVDYLYICQTIDRSLIFYLSRKTEGKAL
jgi:hypothetical protein